MTRIVVHAGFHKTGTSSVQAMIETNRAILSEVARPFLKADFETLTKAARAYSAAPRAAMLGDVQAAARAFFGALDRADARPILMSSEDLSGLMPARRRVTRYDAAPRLMAAIASAAADRFGDADLRFHFSTRGEGWLRSVWWQNLRASRMVDDYPTFAARFADAADLDAIVADVAAAVPAGVTHARLEDVTGLPRGPLEPLLDLVNAPEALRQRLTVLGPINAQPEIDLSDVLLALNRSGFNDSNLATAKSRLRRLANNQGQEG